MSGASNMAQALDREKLRRLFDLRGSYHERSGGGYDGDPYSKWHELREQAPVHEGTVHDLTGYPGPWTFQGLPYSDRPHFSAFTYEACDAAFRDPELFASAPATPPPADSPDSRIMNTMLMMGGAQHRRYRALVQPSFVPAKAQWWITNWIEETVHALMDNLVDEGRAELNVDFCAAIPVLTITGSFGVSVEEALAIREALGDPMKLLEMLAPIVAARRGRPEDDLITVLVEAEYTDEDGVSHRLSDAEIYTFALLLLAAGSGTTWKQMGITLSAILSRPEVRDAVRDDRELVRPAIEESLRWQPTDPVFSRHLTRDTEFHGVHLPEGSVIHLCLAAANRDPSRWDRPDEYDISRPPKPMLAFGNGPHVCLGMHVARAEITVGINALFDRLPNLRLDPEAEPPKIVGFYERGAMDIPVVWG